MQVVIRQRKVNYRVQMEVQVIVPRITWIVKKNCFDKLLEMIKESAANSLGGSFGLVPPI